MSNDGLDYDPNTEGLDDEIVKLFDFDVDVPGCDLEMSLRNDTFLPVDSVPLAYDGSSSSSSPSTSIPKLEDEVPRQLTKEELAAQARKRRIEIVKKRRMERAQRESVSPQPSSSLPAQTPGAVELSPTKGQAKDNYAQPQFQPVHPSEKPQLSYCVAPVTTTPALIEIDQSLIAKPVPVIIPTEEEVKKQLAGLSKDEARKKRRMIRNRISAQLHRQRKAAAVEQLQFQLDDLAKKLNQSETNNALLTQALKCVLGAAPSADPAQTLSKNFPGLVDSLNGGDSSTVPDAINICSGSNSDNDSFNGSSSVSNTPPDSPVHQEQIEVRRTSGRKRRKTARVGSAMAMGMMAMLGLIAVTTQRSGFFSPFFGTADMQSSSSALVVVNKDESKQLTMASRRLQSINELEETDRVDAVGRPLWDVSGDSYSLFDLKAEESDVFVSQDHTTRKLRGGHAPEFSGTAAPFQPSWLFAPEAKASFSSDLLNLNVGRSTVLSNSKALVHAPPTARRSKLNIPSGSGEDPKLLILVPTKSLFDDALEEDYIEMEDTWMELSCKVLGAKIVSGVSFMNM